MAVFTLMSPGGSPGVTTCGLAVSYRWGGRALLAECDPAGGSVLAGFLAGRMEIRHGGLLSLALAVGHRADPSALWEHVVSLDQEAREWLLLPGLRDPREAAQLAGAWETIGEVLGTASEQMIDVVVDVGRVGGREMPLPLIAASDLAVMVLRPTLRQVAAAKPRLEALGRHLGEAPPMGLCLVDQGDYSAGQVSKALFGLPVIGRLPCDSRSAALLSDGQPSRKPVRASALLHGAEALAEAMREHADRCVVHDAGNAVISASRGIL